MIRRLWCCLACKSEKSSDSLFAMNRQVGSGTITLYLHIHYYCTCVTVRSICCAKSKKAISGLSVMSLNLPLWSIPHEGQSDSKTLLQLPGPWPSISGEYQVMFSQACRIDLISTSFPYLSGAWAALTFSICWWKDMSLKKIFIRFYIAEVVWHRKGSCVRYLIKNLKMILTAIILDLFTAI